MVSPQKPSRSWIAFRGSTRLYVSFWGETINPSPRSSTSGDILGSEACV